MSLFFRVHILVNCMVSLCIEKNKIIKKYLIIFRKIINTHLKTSLLLIFYTISFINKLV